MSFGGKARPTRRLIARALLSLPITWLAFGRAAAAMPSARVPIERLYDTLLATMKSGASLGAQGRYDRLRPVIGQTFDLPFMAQMVVGLDWANASPRQQQAMIDAFWRYTTATYASSFDRYGGQQFHVTGEEARGADTIVDSRIVRADGSSVAILYLMHETRGSWLVADVYLDGTISELATRRSEYSSILRENGIDGLVAALNAKASALVGTVGD
jgi:phospholipid transport system substrate-binding protein